MTLLGFALLFGGGFFWVMWKCLTAPTYESEFRSQLDAWDAPKEHR